MAEAVAALGLGDGPGRGLSAGGLRPVDLLQAARVARAGSGAVESGFLPLTGAHRGAEEVAIGVISRT